MTQPSPDQAAIDGMWRAFQRATGTDARLGGSFAFGDGADMADRLAELVLHGPKRATAGLHLDFVHDNEPVPRPGDHWIVLDGHGRPVCVIRTTRVDIVLLNQVDEAFAWDEGEGDRTLAWWREAHERFFRRRCEHLGIAYQDDLATVCERFDLVWPQVRGTGG